MLQSGPMDRQIDVSPRSREQFPSIIFNEGDGRIRGIPRHGYEIYMPGNDELMVLIEQAKKIYRDPRGEIHSSPDGSPINTPIISD